ncbi:MAG: pyruvate dehydrogenase (acetyl-transferring) E1 component subunit alpha [Chloroflexi bacterium]|nr:pyruvate dehydrogenase (acetyl-transferring) E1 component subunit alpha [Chloroflexota bacterium]
MAISDRSVAAVPKEELSALLHKMMLIRRFEQKAAEMYARGRIKGFLHLYTGQEATGVGIISRLRDDDYLYSHYREHGHALARGLEPRAVMAELFGKSTGASRGFGGSMHIFDKSRRFMGGYAIVSSHLPLACGTALACKQLGTDSVTAAIFGDGAVNEGSFHESLNLAAIWHLPVLFVCENNFYGMGTRVNRVTATPEIYKRAEVYGIRSERVDGMDVIAVRERADHALQAVRRGEGPAFIETITYRYRGHSMADPEFYREKSEVEHWRGLDPIDRFTDALLRANVSQGEIDEIQNRVESEIDDAARFAEESPFPPVESLTDHVYAPSPLDVRPPGGGR